MKILMVAGARPNFMKIAPLAPAFRAEGIETFLLHTGQHYDAEMSRVFFDELGIPRPDLNLDVGSGTHAAQTAEIMARFEPVICAEKPDLTLVVGDVNSTLACSLVSAKLTIPVAHVEAGLRSFDDTMPEEINRRLTDQISSYLFVSEPSGIENLAREGVPEGRVHLVGNVMIDTLLRHRETARSLDTVDRLGLRAGNYVVLTLHRPANVDDPVVLRGIIEALERIGDSVSLVFPRHPRTVRALDRHGLADRLAAIPSLRMLKPLGYLDFLALMSDAMAVLTDSGGIQEETTVLGVPCLTLRENTERPITVTQGTNTLVGRNPDRIVQGFERISRGEIEQGRIPDLWDGRAANRIAGVLSS